MHWLIQERFAHEDAYQVMIRTLEQAGIPYTLQEKVIPFVGELIPEPQINTNNVICMGAVALRHAAKRRNWTPGVYDMSDFEFEDHLKHWGDRMLNADSQVVKFGEAQYEGEMFIRPSRDTKAFTGMLCEASELKGWQEQVARLGKDPNGNLTSETLIQVCSPKPIFGEYRFFIVDGKVATASMYKFGSGVFLQEHNENSIYRECVEEALSVWQPLPAFVMDIADTPNGPKIIETNTINSSGMYAIDVQRLVFALEDLNERS